MSIVVRHPVVGFTRPQYDEVSRRMEAYADGDPYRLPMPAVLVTATRPAESQLTAGNR